MNRNWNGNIVTGNGEDTCHSYYRLFWEFIRQQVQVKTIFQIEEIRLWLTVYTWLRANYNVAMSENRCLLTCQRTLPIVFNRFNQAQSWLKKLINQTNRKRFFPNRTRKNPTNSTNQKRLIPIERDLCHAWTSFANLKRTSKIPLCKFQELNKILKSLHQKVPN